MMSQLTQKHTSTHIGIHFNQKNKKQKTKNKKQKTKNPYNIEKKMTFNTVVEVCDTNNNK